jgi:hypothetical protein
LEVYGSKNPELDALVCEATLLPLLKACYICIEEVISLKMIKTLNLKQSSPEQ